MIINYCNFLDEPSAQLFIIFQQFYRLLFQNLGHFSNTLSLALALRMIGQGVLF